MVAAVLESITVQEKSSNEEFSTSSSHLNVVKSTDTEVPAHLKDPFDRSSIRLNEEEKVKLFKQVLVEYQYVFSENDIDVCHSQLVEW